MAGFPHQPKPKAQPQTLYEGQALTIKPERYIWAYEQMLRTRLVDQRIITLYKQNKCHFQISAAGHEAVQVAAADLFRPGLDWFYPYYRDMAMCAALGMSNEEFMLNAMNKQADPNSHGRQMPMHYGHKALRIVSQSSPTGTQFLQAVGCAHGAKLKGLNEVTYVSAGEGTCSQGDFHEALNWAAREKLAIVFLIQNNDFAISVHISEQLAGASVYKLCAGYEGLFAAEVDGTDFEQSYRALRFVHERALNGDGPSLIEAHVPRLQSHSISDNHLKYRTAEQVAGEQVRDPLPRMRKLLLDRKYIKKAELDTLEESIRKSVERAAEWADSQIDCPVTEAETHVFANSSLKLESGNANSGEELFLVDALNRALDEELAHNQDMVVFGQDVAYGKGGVFTVTAGLTDKYGDERVFNAPLAESSIVGVSIGLATRGLRPVPEIQFGDYVWTAMMQIRNEMAMLRYRSAGEFSCPVVIRIPVGGYIHGGCYHSQNIEATFAHFPGLQVVYPSNARDAKGLLKSAIRSEDPVLFLEHKGLYRQVYAKNEIGASDHLIPLGKARIAQAGDDLTIVTWGALVNKSLNIAKILIQEGYTVEVIDLRSIVPLDLECILTSVRRTGRVLIAQEDVEFMGFSAEIAAQIAQHCFQELDAPIERVGMKNVAAVPHSPSLEQVILPQEHDLLAAARRVLMF